MEIKKNLEVLFVDDDEDLLYSVKRMLYALRNVWTLHFALSGKKAIEIIESNKIDVVVCDIRMPVLKYLQENFPSIIRIVLSGYSDQKSILETTKYAHQFLSKPTDTITIINKIQSVFDAKAYLRNEELRSQIAGFQDIITLPDVYIKLEKEISKEEIEIEKIAQIVKSDPLLVAKLLQIINSAFFALPVHITKVVDALSYLGINILKSLVLHICSYNAQNYPPKTKNTIERIASHSLQTASTAKKISKYFDLSKEISDDAYLAGILHDIGKLIIIKKQGDSEFFDNEEYSGNIQKENEIFGFDHVAAGAYLLSIWGIPEPIVEAVAFHHDPSKCSFSNNSALLPVYLSNALHNTNIEILKGYSKIHSIGDEDRSNEYLINKIGLDMDYLNNVSKDVDYNNIIDIVLIN